MSDCFPRPLGNENCDPCITKTGLTEYNDHFRRIKSSYTSDSFAPVRTLPPKVGGDKYSYSKGPRFGAPPKSYCDSFEEHCRFDTTYSTDFKPDTHRRSGTIREPARINARTITGTRMPQQKLYPFTSETTYSRSFDNPQVNVFELAAAAANGEFGRGGGCCYNDIEASGQPAQQRNRCSGPCCALSGQPNGGLGENRGKGGVEIRYSAPCSPGQTKVKLGSSVNKKRLRKEELIAPGTDTSEFAVSPATIQYSPCPDMSRLCQACQGDDNYCNLHMAAATPSRAYPLNWSLPRYVDGNKKPIEPSKMLCGGGTTECPVQSSFPTKEAVKQAKMNQIKRIVAKRSPFPPECLESLHRSSFRSPPLKDVPRYCSPDQLKLSRRMDAEARDRGLPPFGLPSYALDGGRPPDSKPMFDHLSTYEADFVWKDTANKLQPWIKEQEKERAIKIYESAISSGIRLLTPNPACPVVKIPKRNRTPEPLLESGLESSQKLFAERTEEAERWGRNWDVCPPL